MLGTRSMASLQSLSLRWQISCKPRPSQVFLLDQLWCKQSSHSGVLRFLHLRRIPFPLHDTSGKRSNLCWERLVCFLFSLEKELLLPKATSRLDCRHVEEGRGSSLWSVGSAFFSLSSPLAHLLSIYEILLLSIQLVRDWWVPTTRFQKLGKPLFVPFPSLLFVPLFMSSFT